MRSKGGVFMRHFGKLFGTFLCLLFPPFLTAEEDFISHYEYGQMLYENPRGVSCAQCHGKSGEGQLIVAYKDIDGEKRLEGSDIRQDSLKVMINSVKQYHKIMPRYYLTNEEVEAIYDYLKVKNDMYLKKCKKEVKK